MGDTVLIDNSEMSIKELKALKEFWEFLLKRVRDVNEPLPDNVQKSYDDVAKAINDINLLLILNSTG